MKHEVGEVYSSRSMASPKIYLLFQAETREEWDYLCDDLSQRVGRKGADLRLNEKDRRLIVLLVPDKGGIGSCEDCPEAV